MITPHGYVEIDFLEAHTHTMHVSYATTNRRVSLCQNVKYLLALIGLVYTFIGASRINGWTCSGQCSLNIQFVNFEQMKTNGTCTAQSFDQGFSETHDRFYYLIHVSAVVARRNKMTYCHLSLILFCKYWSDSIKSPGMKSILPREWLNYSSHIYIPPTWKYGKE